MDISPLIRRVARGKHGSEHLNQAQARAVFAELLSEQADALQLGAFLIAQRMKGETSKELAGFVEAARDNISGFGTHAAPAGCVDLPCYAGKRRAGHAYLAAALKARDAGFAVFVHGVEHIEGRVTAWQVLQTAGVKRVSNLADAQRCLETAGIVYADLADLCPALFDIYQLRPRLGVRSFANSVARLLNPMSCDGQLNGFFHTPYADYMAHANRLLGQRRSLIFMGAEGEPELYADRQKVVVKQEADSMARLTFDASGFDPYPKEVLDCDSMLAGSLAIMKGELNERERAVIRRMAEAFVWASTGENPLTWREEKKHD